MAPRFGDRRSTRHRPAGFLWINTLADDLWTTTGSGLVVPGNWTPAVDA
jgi:hypothetical protein